jgi:hypothetical protein
MKNLLENKNSTLDEENTAMNIKTTKDFGTNSVALISILLIVVAVTEGIRPLEATSQNATDAFARMGETGSQIQAQEVTSQNATQMALANLTRADLEPVTSALDSARNSLLNNSSQEAYTFLNDADDALFKTAMGEGPSATITIVEESAPIRNHIENAQSMILAGDLPNALNERNLAEVELLRILQGLTAEEEEPPAEEPSTEEEEPPAEEEEEEED